MYVFSFYRLFLHIYILLFDKRNNIVLEIVGSVHALQQVIWIYTNKLYFSSKEEIIFMTGDEIKVDKAVVVYFSKRIYMSLCLLTCLYGVSGIYAVGHKNISSQQSTKQANLKNNSSSCVKKPTKTKIDYSLEINKFFKSISLCKAFCYFFENNGRHSICNFLLTRISEKDVRLKIVDTRKIFSMELSGGYILYKYIDKKDKEHTLKTKILANIWERVLNGNFKYKNIKILDRKKYRTMLDKAKVYGEIWSATVNYGVYEILVMFSLKGDGAMKDVVGWVVYNNCELQVCCILKNSSITYVKSSRVITRKKK